MDTKDNPQTQQPQQKTPPPKPPPAPSTSGLPPESRAAVDGFAEGCNRTIETLARQVADAGFRAGRREAAFEMQSVRVAEHVRAVEAKAAALEEKVAKLEVECKSYRDSAILSADQLANARKGLADARTETKLVRRELARTDEELRRRSEKLRSRAARIEELQRLGKDATARAEKFETELREARGIINHQHKASDSSKSSREADRRAITAATKRVGELELELDAYRNAQKSLLGELEIERGNAKRLRSAVEDLKVEKKGLEKNLECHRDMVDRRDAEISELSRALESRDKMLADHRIEILPAFRPAVFGPASFATETPARTKGKRASLKHVIDTFDPGQTTTEEE